MSLLMNYMIQVNKYNNTYHRTNKIKIKPVDVN